jgi:hypothetical protein
MKKVILVLVFVLGAVWAKDVNSTTNAEKLDKETLKITYELFEATGLKKNMDFMIEKSVKKLIARVPKLKSAEEDLKKFYDKYISYDAVKEDMAKIYAQEFTKEEIKELLKFYNSPVGKKAVEKMPVLFKKGAMLGQNTLNKHQEELKKIIQRALNKK